jgi:hypothetical protein
MYYVMNIFCLKESELQSSDNYSEWNDDTNLEIPKIVKCYVK